VSYPVVYPGPPNQVDFTAFLRTQAGISVASLPDASPYIPDALQIALDIVNETINDAAPDVYTLAVYNLGTDRLINFAPDQTPALATLTWLAGTVTATTVAPLPSNLLIGTDFITAIAGAVPTGYNGNVKATVTGANTFTYALPGNPGANTTPGTYLAPFFQVLRKSWNINTIVTGVVESTNDNGTGMSLAVPEQLKSLTLSDLQRLKTPFGRTYMEIAQTYGQTLWGLT